MQWKEQKRYQMNMLACQVLFSFKPIINCFIFVDNGGIVSLNRTFTSTLTVNQVDFKSAAC